MSITNYSFDQSDADGFCKFDLDFEVVNDSEERISLLRYHTFHHCTDDFLIHAEMGQQTDCDLAPGESFNLSTWGTIHRIYREAGRSTVAHAEVHMFRKEVLNLGEIPISNEESVNYIELGVKSPTVFGGLKLTVARQSQDEDGSVKIDILGTVRNATNIFLEAPEFTAVLKSKSGKEIDSSGSCNNLPPNATTALNAAFWGLKPSVLKGASAAITLTFYLPVCSVSLKRSEAVDS